MRLKAKIKRDIERILVEKKIAGDSRSLILNSLVNYVHNKTKDRELNQGETKNENNRSGRGLL